MNKEKLSTIISENHRQVFVLIKGIFSVEVNQEKKYFSGIFDKKCTFELLPVQMFSMQVHAFVETHEGS